MSEQPATSQRVTAAEAAVILGVSTTTIRRMVKRGELEGERVHRPQGTAFVVTLPTDAAEDAAPMRQVAGAPPRGNASPAGQLATWSETFLVPLVAALERSQETVREQAETIGTLRAENQALLASTALQTVEPTQEPPTPLSRLLSLWRWLVLVLVVAVTTMVTLLAWPR